MQSLILAEQSSDLGEAYDGLGDVDFLRAAGMVGQQYNTALATWRFVELRDQHAARAAFDGCAAWLVWKKRVSDPLHVASSVLLWMRDKTCPHCHGRCFETIPGAPKLSDTPCPHCHGTGKRPKDWGPAGHDLHEWLLQQQREAARAIIAKLKR